MDNRIQYIGAEKTVICGNLVEKHISTGYVERQNLTMWMQMRWFARKTNGHLKKFENHCHAQAIYFVYYNFMKISHDAEGNTGNGDRLDNPVNGD